MYTTSDAIAVADHLIGLAEHERQLVDTARESLAAPGLNFRTQAQIRQVLHTSRDCHQTYLNWKNFGRHTININPDLYRELSLAETSAVPGEVLWALPYRNPMVVYPHKPLVDLGTYSRRRILGFYLSGLTSTEPRLSIDAENQPSPIGDTHDRSTTALRITIYTEVLDENDQPCDYETFYYSIPRSGTDTFADLCTQITDRLIRYGGSMPRLGDGLTMTDPEMLATMLSPLLATVFYLCSTTVDAQPVSKTIVRRRTPKKRKPVDLVHVGWRIGPELSRLRRASVATSPVFIAPFWVHPELLGVDASTTLNPAKPTRKKTS